MDLVTVWTLHNDPQNLKIHITGSKLSKVGGMTHQNLCEKGTKPIEKVLDQSVIPADMEFVQNFTPPDFQAKTFTPSISPNFTSFSKKKNTKNE